MDEMECLADSSATRASKGATSQNEQRAPVKQRMMRLAAAVVAASGYLGRGRTELSPPQWRRMHL